MKRHYEEKAYEVKKLPRSYFAPGHFPRCGNCKSRLPKAARGKPSGQTFRCGDCGQQWKLDGRVLVMSSMSHISGETLKILRGGLWGTPRSA